MYTNIEINFLLYIEGINLQRYKAAKPGGYPMREISVTGTGPFTVTMSPFDCGNGFDLFKVADSQVRDMLFIVIRNTAFQSLTKMCLND